MYSRQLTLLIIEVNKLAGDVGIPSGADGAIDKEVDQGMQGNLGGNNQGGGGGQAADGMINQGKWCHRMETKERGY